MEEDRLKVSCKVLKNGNKLCTVTDADKPDKQPGIVEVTTEGERRVIDAGDFDREDLNAGVSSTLRGRAMRIETESDEDV